MESVPMFSFSLHCSAFCRWTLQLGAFNILLYSQSKDALSEAECYFPE